MLVESPVRDGIKAMGFARRAICVGGLMIAVCAALPATAGTIQVTSAGAEYATFHPRRSAGRAPSGDFQATMDKVFGAGRWRKTSGYRSQAEEDALRRQGAGTVAPGHLSKHSVGGSDAPGAYDAVVANMPLARAAAKLRDEGAFSRVVAEGAHGPQGAHLHIELTNGPRAAAADDTFYRRGDDER